MIQLPIIGSFMEAAATILSKKVLKRKKLSPSSYIVYEFLAIIALMLPFVFLFWKVSPEALYPKNIAILAFVIIIAILANLLVFYSLKRENVTEFEPIWIMQPLFTIILSFMIYQSERDWALISLALIASVALILAHVKKHHLVYDRYIIAALVGSFLFSVELVASKSILQYYNPFNFYFIRGIFIFIICAALFRPSGKELNKRTGWMIAAIAILWVLCRAIIYYGYESAGIVFTTIIFILSPVFMFVFAIIFLKEKPTVRQIISTVIIVACVIASVILRYK